MRLRLHAAGVETEVPFESWLQGAEPLCATASVSTPVTQSGAGPRIQIAGPVQITFQPNWDLRFQGAGAVNLTGLGGATTSDTLRIALLDGDAPGLMLAPEAIRSLISIRNSGTAWHDWTALRTLAGGRLTWRRNPFDAILLEAAEHPGGRRTRALLATAAAANQDVMLDAEDLVRGYCVDVWHSATKSWHPLCRRVGTYDFLTAGETLVIEDEGWVSTAVSSASDGSSGRSLRAGTAIPLARLESRRPPTRPHHRQRRPGRRHSEHPAIRVPASDRFQGRPRLAAPPALRRQLSPARPRRRSGRQQRPLRRSPLRRLLPGHRSRCVRPLRARRQSRARAPQPPHRGRFHGEDGHPQQLQHHRRRCRRAARRPPKIDQLTAEMDARFDSSNGLDKAAYAGIIAREAGGYHVGGTIDDNNNKLPYFDVDSLPQPYLSDPLARGAAFRGLPGNPPGVPCPVPFIDPDRADWPDTRTFRLQLVEGDPGGAEFDPVTHVLKVSLPKAEILNIRYNCYLDSNDLAKLALWEWLSADPGVSEEQLAELKSQAVQGSHWMFTPFRELMIVHAVQQPLLPPEFSPDLKAIKALGATFAQLSDTMSLSGKSTSKVNVLGEWTDPIDALGEPKWQTVPGRSEAFEIPVAYEDTDLQFRGRHQFGDTKHRFVDYTAVATTRFAEYFTEGTTPFTRQSAAPHRMNILNSARPESPKVLYVVPTFGWTGQANDGSLTSTRTGGGLRVYMERPWWSSGEGELLGVVIWPRPPALPSQGTVALLPPEIPNELRTLATQWGMDPIWTAQPLEVDTPITDHFTRAVATNSNLTLDELPGATVSVAGHRLGYDEDRQLWYCDIDIDVGDAYYPFIRLALARYQPDSVDDAHLSRVVLADFAQVAPNRTVSVAFASSPTDLIATLARPGYERSAGVRDGAIVEVTVEQRIEGRPGDLGWAPVTDGVFPLEIPELRSDATPVWTGPVVLPEPRSSRPFRLVIREYEQHLFVETDRATENKTVRRLVYADILEL